MKDSKLIRLVRTFSKKEWKEFEKFTASPYFNKGRNYNSYMRALKLFYPAFNSKDFTREYVYNKIYPGKNYNDSVMYTVTSGLYSIAEEFLIQKNIEANTFKKEMNLLLQLSARNIDGIHNKRFAEIEKKLHGMKAGQDIFELFAELQSHRVQHSMKGNYEKSVKENIPVRADYNIFGFIFKLLNEVRDFVVLKNTYNITPEQNLSNQIFFALDFNKLIEYTENHYPDISPVIITVVNCYIASITTDDIYFKAKKAIMENYSRFDNNLLRELILIMEGGASMRLNSGNRQFVREWHELHRFGLEKGLHIYETLKYVHPLIVHNMLNIAFWNKEYGWIESFIKDHQCEFPDEFKNYLISIGNVYLYISRKEFGQALKTLTTIDDSLFSFKKRVRTLLLIIYYELNDFELAHNGLDSFRHFIDNNQKKYSEREKKSSVLFAVIYEQLLKQKFENSEINLKQLTGKIHEANPSQSFDWCLEKIEELKKKELFGKAN